MLPLPKHVAEPNPEIYFSDNYVVLDVETTNKAKGNPSVPENRLILSVWYDGLTDEYHKKWGSEYEIQELVARIEKADFLVAHNAKMELGWLRRAGLDLRKVVVFDTIVAEYVLAGNKRAGLGLGTVGLKYGVGTKDPFIDALMHGGVCPSEMPRSFLQARCYKDVWQTLEIFKSQRKVLHDCGMLATCYTHCLLTPCLADIERRGMHLDPEMTAEEYTKAVEKYKELEEELEGMTGGINLGSPKQRAEFLYDVLKLSRPKDKFGKEISSTGADALATLKPTNNRQRDFLKKYGEYNDLNALIKKNLRFFDGVCKHYGNVFIAQFNQTVTRTHRLSSSGVPLPLGKNGQPASVQFQNMPRPLKRLFCSRRVAEGWEMGEVDGAQLEFRVAGFLGQDSVAYKSIMEGEDVHSFTAQVLTEAGQPTDRQGAKPHTFKPLYGGLSGTPAEVAYYTAFKRKYPGIAHAQESWKDEVLRTKELLLPTGMRFYWPDTTVTRSGYMTNSTNICNYPVQYFATAEIIPIGLVCMWHRMAEMQSYIVNTIHDSIISEVHPDEKDDFTKLGQHCLTNDVYDYLYKQYGIKFNFPLGTGTKISRNWGMTKDEIKYESTPKFEFKQEETVNE